MTTRPAWAVAWLATAVLCMGMARAAVPVEARETQVFATAEAVRGGWQDSAPPATGWTPVTLFDDWSARWPGHDGVVWYRLRWQQADAHAPVALLLDYWSMGGAAYVNGSLIHRDPKLVEPLSRSWVAPRYFLVDAPLLHAGENTLLLRVSGLSAYAPGLGEVTLGDPAQVFPAFQRSHLLRYDLQLLDMSIGLVLGVLFLLFWALRRRDTTYGWYAVTALFGSLYGYNFVATSPWPFAGTDRYQAVITALYLAGATSYVVFLLRYCERRWPWTERMLGLLTVSGFVLALIAPHWLGLHRGVWFALAIAINYLATLVFVAMAVPSQRTDYKVLAACVVVPLLVSVHDLAVFYGWIDSDLYLLSLTSPVMLLGMGFVLAHRFVGAMRRVEGFNTELKREVSAATGELAETLSRQHALELAHSQTGERLKLVRDLHDGFGGTLVGAIARLEQAPADTPKARIVDLLKEMRDDLRLVIDSTAREQADLAELLVPLRHRASRLLEAADIDSYWHVQGLAGLELGTANSLDLLRLLQEALTNVFKHSSARRVDVRIEHIDGHLHLQVRDDGVGLPANGTMPTAGHADGGAGLASMRLRAQRLGGELRIVSATTGGTELQLDMPLAA